MPYYKTTTIAGKTIQVVKHHGKRIIHEGSRNGKSKATPEEMKATNERNRIRKLTLILNANFTEGDHWLTLTYPSYYKPPEEVAIKEVNKLLTNLRKEYRRYGTVLKYVLIKEFTARGVHFHIAIKDVENAKFLKLIKKHWKYGTHDKEMYSVEFSQLASYIVKEKTKKTGKYKQRYSCSRNMIRPEPETELISRSNGWRDIPMPKKGYFIPQATIYNGFDAFGYKLQRYTLVSLEGNVPPPYIVSMEEYHKWQTAKEEFEKDKRR